MPRIMLPPAISIGAGGGMWRRGPLPNTELRRRSRSCFIDFTAIRGDGWLRCADSTSSCCKDADWVTSFATSLAPQHPVAGSHVARGLRCSVRCLRHRSGPRDLSPRNDHRLVDRELAVLRAAPVRQDAHWERDARLEFPRRCPGRQLVLQASRRSCNGFPGISGCTMCIICAAGFPTTASRPVSTPLPNWIASPKLITLRESLGCWRLALWDERRRSLVGFRDLKPAIG